MTNNQHGQVPEALIDLIDAYAETRHRYGRIYNAKTEAARNAVIEALSGVQALSAASEAFLKSVIALCSHRGYSPANIEAWDKDDKWIADLWRQAESMLAASPTPTAEQQAQPGAVGRTGCTAGTDEECTRRGCATSCPAQQAAPKAAPGEPSDYQIRAITTAYEQGVGKGHQAYKSGKEIANPYDSAYGCDLAWQYGYGEGKEQAQRGVKPDRQCLALYTAPQPSPTAPATQQPEGDVVAYLDVGANGYLDLGSELSEDALQQLPKGRHALVIAGTYGIDGYVAAPQPAPAPLSDDVVRDAARWRMAALIGNELMLRPEKRTHATAVKAYMDATHGGSDLTGAVDAALAAQGGK